MAPRCPPPDEYDIGNLTAADLQGYDIFTMASSGFWQHHTSVVTGFFHNLRAVGSRGFLVTRPRSQQTSECDRATALGIRCVSSCHYPSDTMLSKEKWFIISYFLRFGKAVMAAGADVRLLAPVGRLFRASGSVDMTFEGNAHNGRIRVFTPDLLLAFATPRAKAFVDAVRQDIALSDSTDPDVHVRGLGVADVGGEANLQWLKSHQTTLAGPAEQDLLVDTFASVLYNRTQRERKIFLARRQLGLPLVPSSPSDHRRPYELGVPRLPARATRSGIEISTPRLKVLLTTERMVISAGSRDGRPCDNCDGWANEALALHCNGKRPECLDLTSCACLGNELREAMRASAAAALTT